MSKITISDEKICSKCLKNKNIKRDYYLAANNIINADNRLPVCKSCLNDLVDMNDVETLINVMRMIDRPFLKNTYEDALLKTNSFGEYMRMLGTRQNRDRTYLNGEFEGHFEEMIAKDSKHLNNPKTIGSAIKFKITPDLILKWGSGYPEQELYQLETFYESMITANDITSPQHREALKLICKLNLEQNKALDESRINDFKNLNTQYNKTMQDSGIRPIDRKSGGESAGVRTFSQIWEEIEKDGFIEPYPYQEKQDIVDRTIMYMGNYTRKLLNMQSMSRPPDDTPEIDRSDDE